MTSLDPQVFTGQKSMYDNRSSWKNFLVTEEPEYVPPLFQIGNAPVWTSSNHSLIIGKKKTRKSLLITWMVSQYSGDISNDILIADTEQGVRHVWKTRDRIFRMTGKCINILTLRGLNKDERRKVIEEAINECGFKVVVIDGIRDLLSDINNVDQCAQLVTWIEKMTVTHDLHIVNVLHQNKTDNNARGHIGSELLNKAEITIQVDLDEQSNCSVVKCESSRDVPFESFAFKHNDEDLPQVVLMPTKGGEGLTEYEQTNRLSFVFEDGLLKRCDVIKGLKDHFELGTNAAEKLLAQYVRNGWIVKNGRDHSSETRYKLMVTPLKPVV